MRYGPAEKMEVIRTVEGSDLSITQTLRELDIPRSTFYDWYARYWRYGYKGLADTSPTPRRFWNRIPAHKRERIVDLALRHPEKSPRELAWHITDHEGYFISESSVYRILKNFDLITSPAYIVLSAPDRFRSPTRRVNELWQTDFTHFKIVGWGWYYLMIFDLRPWTPSANAGVLSASYPRSNLRSARAPDTPPPWRVLQISPEEKPGDDIATLPLQGLSVIPEVLVRIDPSTGSILIRIFVFVFGHNDLLV